MHINVGGSLGPFLIEEVGCQSVSQSVQSVSAPFSSSFFSPSSHPRHSLEVEEEEEEAQAKRFINPCFPPPFHPQLTYLPVTHTHITKAA